MCLFCGSSQISATWSRATSSGMTKGRERGTTWSQMRRIAPATAGGCAPSWCRRRVPRIEAGAPVAVVVCGPVDAGLGAVEHQRVLLAARCRGPVGAAEPAPDTHEAVAVAGSRASPRRGHGVGTRRAVRSLSPPRAGPPPPTYRVGMSDPLGELSRLLQVPADVLAAAVPGPVGDLGDDVNGANGDGAGALVRRRRPASRRCRGGRWPMAPSWSGCRRCAGGHSDP
jgi:hypothetical protein